MTARSVSIDAAFAAAFTVSVSCATVVLATASLEEPLDHTLSWTAGSSDDTDAVGFSTLQRESGELAVVEAETQQERYQVRLYGGISIAAFVVGGISAVAVFAGANLEVLAAAAAVVSGLAAARASTLAQVRN